MNKITRMLEKQSSDVSLPRTVVVTDFTSPYQIELFNAVADRCPDRLAVIYLHQRSQGRKWAMQPLRHEAVLMQQDTDAMSKAAALVDAADLVVFNFYDDLEALALIRRRVALGKAWCFWGERPGFYHRLLGRLRRIWMLAPLHRQRAAIWGIGSMAVNAYREEFGAFRDYVTLPYFSDLTRFEAIPLRTGRARDGCFTILYSGALIRRKGVDLVASAFVRLAKQHPQARLRIVGAGPLDQRLRRILQTCADQVEFTGFKDWSELPAEYARADVLCVPSRYDGWGLVVPEGLAAGLPVIGTTQTGAAVEFLQNALNGWLVAANDENAVYEAMSAAIRLSAEQFAAMSHAARAAVVRHSLDHGALRFIQAAVNAQTGW